MPAYNHTRKDVVEQTRDDVTLDQEGNFYCHHCGGFTQAGYIGRSSLAVQRHFQREHDYEFGHRVFEWLDDPLESRAPFAGHMLTEGINT